MSSFPSWSLGASCFHFTVTPGRCDPRWVTLAESDFALHTRPAADEHSRRASKQSFLDRVPKLELGNELLSLHGHTRQV